MEDNVAKVLVGRLDHQKFHFPYLVNCVFLDRVDSTKMARLAKETLHDLWSDEFDSSRLQLFVTDTATYML